MEESPFNTKENTIQSVTTFIAEGLKGKQKKDWQSFWTLVVVYNQTSTPPLPEDELKQLFDNTLTQLEESLTQVEQEQITPEKIQKLFKKNKAEGTYLLAKYIVNKYQIITIGEKDREMFLYKDGMYYPNADNLTIYPEMQKVLGDQVTRSAKSETHHKIADMTSHPRSVFQEADPRYIPLKNGVYDFQTNRLLPHSPEYRFTYQFPIVYDPNATCPKTEKFFKEILPPEQEDIVLEWIGYYFYRRYIFKKAIIFVGAGDTGKTTLLEVISYLLGKENTCSVALQKMTGDKFSAAHLYQKHGNLVDELSARDITDTGAFKIATGGGTITGEYKFGNQFSFHNYAKFTFACNRIPDVKDTNDEAYFNRWMVVRFENPIKKVIPNFIDTLKTEEERSGLFNLVMEALRRLLDKKRFSYYNTAEDTKNAMMQSGSSIPMFVSHCLERDYKMGYMSRDDMYEAYVQYCTDNKLAPQTKEMLGRRLTDNTNYIVDSTAEVPNGIGKSTKIRVWRNVKLRETAQQVEEKDEIDKAFNDF